METLVVLLGSLFLGLTRSGEDDLEARGLEMNSRVDSAKTLEAWSVSGASSCRSTPQSDRGLHAETQVGPGKPPIRVSDHKFRLGSLEEAC